jgi:hypothetical protein
MSDRIERKLAALRDKYANPAGHEVTEYVESLEKAYHSAAIRDHLASHEAMKPVRAQLARDIGDMGQLLLSADSKTLPDSERDRVLDRKKLYEWFLGLVGGSKEELRQLEAEIDVQLNHETD